MNNSFGTGSGPSPFAKAARRAFSFLLDLGFTEVDAGESHVHYGKQTLQVEIVQAPASAHVHIALTYCGGRFDIVEIVKAVRPMALPLFEAALATPPGPRLGQLASLMQRYVATALRGDAQFYWDLERARDVRRDAAGLDEQER